MSVENMAEPKDACWGRRENPPPVSREPGDEEALQATSEGTIEKPSVKSLKKEGPCRGTNPKRNAKKARLKWP